MKSGYKIIRFTLFTCSLLIIHCHLVYALCVSVPNTNRELLINQALVANAQTYGAVSLYETGLTAHHPIDDRDNFHFVMKANSIFNVLTLPSNCNAEPRMRHFDITSTAWGFSYALNQRISLFYSTAITASALTPLGPVGRYYAPLFLLLGSLPYGVVSPLAGVAWPRAVRNRDFSFASDYIGGATIDLSIAKVALGYVGTEGVFLDLDQPYLGFFGRTTVHHEGWSELVYAKIGFSHLDWLFSNEILKSIGSSALFMRMIQWKSSLTLNQANNNQLDKNRNKLKNVPINTLHFEQWNIAKSVDIVGAIYTAPFVDFKELTLSWHSGFIYPTSGNAHPRFKASQKMSRKNDSWIFTLGVIKIPDIFYYGIHGGYRLRASIGRKVGREAKLTWRLELNSPEVSVAFPYADNYLQLVFLGNFYENTRR